MSRHSADTQRPRVYEWEASFCPEEEPPAIVRTRDPFEPEFRKFHAETWCWGYARYGGGLHPIITGSPPRLRYANRLRSHLGNAGIRIGRDGKGHSVITFGQHGPTRKTLLHEQAHLLCHGPTLFGSGEGHGPRFCKVVLDLYVQFLGVDPRLALSLSHTHGIEIEGITIKPRLLLGNASNEVRR